jgi:hypothetical protein
MSVAERLCDIRDAAIEVARKKMNEIIKAYEAERESVVEAEPAEAVSVATTTEDVDVDTEVEIEPPATAHAVPPEPKSTKPHPAAERKGRDGGLNRSQIIRDYFDKHREARNKDVIEYMKERHKIDVTAGLVSTVKASMDIPKGKPGRPKGSKNATVVAKKHRISDLPMTACCAEVLARAKSGLRLGEIMASVKKSGKYNYQGEKGEKGFKQTVYQALNTLKQKKTHPGWKGTTSIVIHDKAVKRYRLNPKAKREYAA